MLVVVFLPCGDGLPKLQLFNDGGIPWASLLVFLFIGVDVIEHDKQLCHVHSLVVISACL